MTNPYYPQSPYFTQKTTPVDNNFQAWLGQTALKNPDWNIGNITYPTENYDLPGYAKYSSALSAPSPGQGGLHLTDLYKLPNHPTFSDQSGYATGPASALAGKWMHTTLGQNTKSAAYLPSFMGLMSGKTPQYESWK